MSLAPGPDPAQRRGVGARARSALLICAALAGVLLLGGPPPVGAQIFPEQEDPNPPPARVLDVGDHRDPRVVEILRYDCQDQRQRRDVTLFANGTVRKREGRWEDQEMTLEELGPDELRSYVTRLVEIRASDDFPDQFQVEGGVRGQWLDHCRFGLDVPGHEAVALEVGILDALPHSLQRLVEIAEELGAMTRPLVRPRALPPGFEPEIGDVLTHFDGREFEVVRQVPDTGQWELDSRNGMHRMHIFAADMPQIFVTVERPDRSYP